MAEVLANNWLFALTRIRGLPDECELHLHQHHQANWICLLNARHSECWTTVPHCTCKILIWVTVCIFGEQKVLESCSPFVITLRSGLIQSRVALWVRARHWQWWMESNLISQLPHCINWSHRKRVLRDSCNHVLCIAMAHHVCQAVLSSMCIICHCPTNAYQLGAEFFLATLIDAHAYLFGRVAVLYAPFGPLSNDVPRYALCICTRHKSRSNKLQNQVNKLISSVRLLLFAFAKIANMESG